MKDQDSWDRYGAFYEGRPKAAAPSPSPSPRRFAWRKAAWWLFGAAFSVGFWWLFFWLGTRHWPH